MPNSGLCSLSVCLNCSPVLHVVFDVVCTIYALWVNENLTNNYYYYHTPHIFYWNCRSLSNKLTHFQSFVYSSPFHVIASSETWLTDKIYSRANPCSWIGRVESQLEAPFSVAIPIPYCNIYGAKVQKMSIS